MKTSYDKFTKIFTKCPGHLTKMGDMPIYGKKPFNIFYFRTRRLMTLGLGMKLWGCWVYQVYSNNDPRLTQTYLTSRTDLLPNAFKWDFFGKVDFFNTVKAKVIIFT